MKQKKHVAEQYELPVKLAVTLVLSPHHSALWQEFLKSNSALAPSNSQVAKAMIQGALDSWAKEKGIGNAKV